MRIPYLICAAALAGCGGAAPGPVPAELSSEQVVRAFMKAVADSNLMRMGDLWGTSRGPANQTHFPPGYEKRLAVMQVWLKGDSIRVLSDFPVRGKSDERQVAVELHRGTCVKQIPMTTVRTSKGWLVQTVDVSAAGNPVMPCQGGS